MNIWQVHAEARRAMKTAQAAIRAGYSAASARQIADENLSKPDIQEHLGMFKDAVKNDYSFTGPDGKPLEATIRTVYMPAGERTVL